jgi:hypothetical protein
LKRPDRTEKVGRPTNNLRCRAFALLTSHRSFVIPLWVFHRSSRGRRKSGNSSGDSRLDGLEDPFDHGAVARLRNRAGYPRKVMVLFEGESQGWHHGLSFSHFQGPGLAMRWSRTVCSLLRKFACQPQLQSRTQEQIVGRLEPKISREHCLTFPLEWWC